MRALHLDYQRRANLAVKIGAMLLVAGLAAALLATGFYYRLGRDVGLWETRIAEIEGSAQQKPIADPGTSSNARQVSSEMKDANEVLLQLALPWDDLFKAVETSDDDKIALLSIEPDAQKQLVRISGEARSLDCMLNYVRLLQESGLLSEVNLKNHQIYQQDPDKPIRFSLVAAWIAKP